MHPAPVPGEALTSWLRRIAHRHGAEVQDLVLDLGYCLSCPEDLDTVPPEGFIDHLAARTGAATDTIRAMTLNGQTPWLLDQLQPAAQAYTTYTRQLTVLLPPGRRRDRAVDHWRPWAPTDAGWQHRACPLCTMESSPPCPYQLTWLVPLMLSCPVHHCRLERYNGPVGYHDIWHTSLGGPAPRPVNAAIRRMDERTWQALTTGHVALPRHRVHAGIWFRLLRTLLDELGATLTECGTYGRLTREVWERAGHPVRAGQHPWRPYEHLTDQQQTQSLEAAATAIHLLETRVLAGLGHEAALFLPPPNMTRDPGRPHQTMDPTALRWQEIKDSLDATVEEARTTPETARQLFNFCTMYRGEDDHIVREVRGSFTKLGIPLEYLSPMNDPHRL
ncbi:TniQ family protein [Hoyosella altamirensis]|nr:TniQ family protein [Hoyosella altamirensis]